MINYRIKLLGSYGNVLHTWINARTLNDALQCATTLYLGTEWSPIKESEPMKSDDWQVIQRSEEKRTFPFLIRTLVVLRNGQHVETLPDNPENRAILIARNQARIEAGNAVQ